MFKNFFNASSACYWKGASNDMPNCFLFGVAFDRPGSSGEAFFNITSNLPPTKAIGRKIAVVSIRRMFNSGRQSG